MWAMDNVRELTQWLICQVVYQKYKFQIVIAQTTFVSDFCFI